MGSQELFILAVFRMRPRARAAWLTPSFIADRMTTAIGPTRTSSLSFRRLSILDLATGAQPMANEDKSVWVIFNGEIYNHLELRRELIGKGHIFHTDHSDTEVLVHGYEEWGERLPERLNGMFAFALWDQRRRRLFLARDRHGIKPLYMATMGDGTLIFGSEVRAIHASGLVPIATRAGGVIEYFSLMNFWHGRTPFRAVDLLAQGMTATVDPTGIRSRRYWDYSFQRKSVRHRADAVDRLRVILRDAIRRQAVADVVVTAYLSGGIDSSAITAAAYQSDPSVRGYSCIFDLENVGEDRFVDEREFSRAVAKELAIDRVEHVIPQMR